MLSRRRFLKGGAGGIAGAWVMGAVSTTGGVAAAAPGGRRTKTGVEVFIEEQRSLVAGKEVGIVTNPTGVMPDLGHEVDVLAQMPDVDLVAVFGPEHGFRGTAQAGGSEGFFVDEKTGLPVYDTHGKSGQALADIFESSGVDVVMFDIQDVGARFYTYIWTMFDCMEAAVMADKSFIVLDRPNPITGISAEGPVLHPEFSTFVGRKPISQRHGMTVGELAQLFNKEFIQGRKVDLTVVPMRGWSRDMLYAQTGLPWVLPSPNMPTVDTATVYVGTCYFEGTNLSEGRGTTRPFELLGAPYIDWRLNEDLRARNLSGVEFREAHFAPTFSKYRGETVGGTQLHVEDAHELDPIRAALAIIVDTKRRYPNDFEWRFDSFDPERPYWIDKLSGSEYVRTAVDAGKDVEEIVAGWQGELADFRRMRSKYLIYETSSGVMGASA